MKVLVTGATGRTGALVMEKLRFLPDTFEPIGLARSPDRVAEKFGSTEGFIIGDITNFSDIETAIAGCEKLVILTSAVPQLKAPPQQGQKPEFEFEPGGMPETVDWLGQKNQIDAAKQAGVQHIVLVGSMGGTNSNHPLNSLGNGKILIWKRQAEQYLIDSGIKYTIIRAGGLLDQPGGQRELIVGKDDNFLTAPPNGIPTNIPRADVAELVVQALIQPQAIDKAFDVIAKPEDDRSAVKTSDFKELFARTTPDL
jgi:uncharacterized protein YbjT (DUF2867 family)